MRNNLEFSVCGCTGGKHKSRNHRKHKIEPRVREYNRRITEVKKELAKAKKRKGATVQIKVEGKK
jgi:hypothetical protein